MNYFEKVNSLEKYVGPMEIIFRDPFAFLMNTTTAEILYVYNYENDNEYELIFDEEKFRVIRVLAALSFQDGIENWNIYLFGKSKLLIF